MKNRKVNAFTLAELLVVLVISSIVISAAFLVLNMVRKQVILIQKNYEKKQEVRFFEATLQRDFNTRRVIYNNEKLLLLSSTDTIHYTFLEKGVVRQKDTFYLEFTDKKVFLDGMETKKSSEIDAIELDLSEAFANKQLFISKVKDASYYLNN